MRTKEQINKELKPLEKNIFENIKIELLLDIRELLEDLLSKWK